MFEDDRDTAYVEVLEAYGRLLRYGELMWQHHSEFLLLGYGAYATFVDFCKGSLPDIPDQHIAQMVAGIDVLLFRPDAELKRLARLAIETGVDSAFVEGRSPEEIDAELAQSEAGRGMAGGARAGERPVVQHGHGRRSLPLLRQLARRPDHSLRVARRLRARAEGEAKRSSGRPRSSPASGTGSRSSTAALLDEETRKGFDELLGLSRMVFPYVEEHKFLCDYWFLTRWWNKVREFGALLAKHGYLEDAEDVFQLSRHEVASALDELVLDVGDGRRAARPEALAADRRAPQGDPRAARRTGLRRPPSAPCPRR